MPSSSQKLRIIQGKSSLKQLIEACPELWQETGTEINRRLAGAGKSSGNQVSISAAGSASLNEYVTQLNAKAENWSKNLRKSRFNLGMVERAFADIVRSRMAWLALQNYYLAALGGQEGKIRFGWWSGTILQKLLFSRGFDRKPVSLFWYRLGWKLVTQKKILMRLVYKKGIYCFYSRRLIAELAKLIRRSSPSDKGAEPSSPILEIAAGDGTLSRFLAGTGLQIQASDDFSWESTAKAAKQSALSQVMDLEAGAAIAKYQPSVVICSWPPAGNQFERKVFKSAATRLYIVIGSRHHFASGNWDCYQEFAQPVSPGASSSHDSSAVHSDQRPFTMEIDERLSKLVLPRELDNAVLVFRPKS